MVLRKLNRLLVGHDFLGARTVNTVMFEANKKRGAIRDKTEALNELDGPHSCHGRGEGATSSKTNMMTNPEHLMPKTNEADSLEQQGKGSNCSTTSTYCNFHFAVDRHDVLLTLFIVSKPLYQGYQDQGRNYCPHSRSVLDIAQSVTYV